MKCIFLYLLPFLALVSSCKKNEKATSPNEAENYSILNENTIIVTNENLGTALISVDSNTLVFNSGGVDVDKIKLGSVLVSDMTTVAPDGFLRKIVAITEQAGHKVCKTEQATFLEALAEAKVTFKKSFTAADIIGTDTSGNDIAATQKITGESFNIPFSLREGNTTISGSIELEPSMDFELDIQNFQLQKFKAAFILKNTNKIGGKVGVKAGTVSEQYVLKTIQLKPFTIKLGKFPIPIKHWIVIVMGTDGTISAEIAMEAVNTNTLTTGITYEGSSWKNLDDVQNNFSMSDPTFSAKASLEGWLQTRYEMRPYGLRQSRIFLAAKASLFGEAEAQLPDTCLLRIKMDWGVKLSAKAQMVLFGNEYANYDNEIFSRRYPLYDKTKVPVKAETDDVTDIKSTTIKCGGKISYLNECHPTILSRGLCWNTAPDPTVMNSKQQFGSGTGSFSGTVSGLDHSTTYYIRAYAITSGDTVYGAEKSFKTTGYKIGDTAFGGIIFYLDATRQHGMVCAMTDQARQLHFIDPARINNMGTGPIALSNTFDSIGAGIKNTEMIIDFMNAHGNVAMAADSCKNYNGGGYTDWFLPSSYELIELYKHKDKIPSLIPTLYWTSSGSFQAGSGANLPCQIFAIDFSNGTHDNITYHWSDPYPTANVIAVRKF